MLFVCRCAPGGTVCSGTRCASPPMCRGACWSPEEGSGPPARRAYKPTLIQRQSAPLGERSVGVRNGGGGDLNTIEVVETQELFDAGLTETRVCPGPHDDLA